MRQEEHGGTSYSSCLVSFRVTRGTIHSNIAAEPPAPQTLARDSVSFFLSLLAMLDDVAGLEQHPLRNLLP